MRAIQIALVIGAAIGSARAQTVRYVDDSAAAGGDGLAWSTAYRYLRDAIAASPVDTEFRIGGGIQRPDVGTGVVQFDRNASFNLKSGSVLRGGYRGLAGGGGSPDDRDLAAFATVITGDLMGNDPTYSDNSYHLFEVTGSITSVAFDGLTLHGGRASASGTQGIGGGIRQTAGALFVNDVTFEVCFGHDGGAIYFGGTNATVTHCEFRTCGAVEGAALRLSGNTATFDDCTCTSCNGAYGIIEAVSSSVTVRNSTFDTGFSASGGGAINATSCTVLVEDSSFRNFDSSSDGGAIFVRDSATTIRRTEFAHNETSADGAAVMAWYGTLTIEDSKFDDNVAHAFGGALHSLYPDPLIVRRCTFTHDRAYGGQGGAVWAGQIGLGSVLIEDCSFLSNTGQFGGGISLQATGTISRCIFASNEGVNSGGGMRLDASPVGPTIVDHCTIYDNRNSGGAMLTSGSGVVQVTNTLVWSNHQPQIVNQGATLTIAYCDIQVLPANFNGSGNFDSEPLLYSPAAYDFHLRPGSPCIDTGDPNAPLDPDGSRADVGAFPFEPNYALAPSTYCTAGTSTHGCSASLSWVGSASATGATNLVITASGLDGQKSGIVFYGTTGPAGLPWGTSTSFLCANPPSQRTPAQNSGGTNGACDGSLALNWNAFLASEPGALGVPFVPGDAVWAQCWYRDPPSPKTTHLSNALQFVIGP